MSKYNFDKLRGLIKEKLGNESNYAKLLGLSNSSISAKLNSQVPFSVKEIEVTFEKLQIPSDEIYQYFFTKKVEKNSTNVLNNTSNELVQELDDLEKEN